MSALEALAWRWTHTKARRARSCSWCGQAIPQAGAMLLGSLPTDPPRWLFLCPQCHRYRYAAAEAVR